MFIFHVHDDVAINNDSQEKRVMDGYRFEH